MQYMLLFWEPTVYAHTREQGCPGCINRIPWTLDRFIVRARKVHGEYYDYSRITEAHIGNCNSRIPVKCNKCFNCWTPTIDSHVKGIGCPQYNTSKGEKACIIVLKDMNIEYRHKFNIFTLPRAKGSRFLINQVDLLISNSIIIETDGF